MVTTGWALFEDNKLIKNGTFKTKSTLPIEKRLGQIWQYISDLYKEYKFDKIAFEDIQNQNNNETYRKLAYCQAVIYLWCDYNEIGYSVLGPSHWRKILGGGFGSKREEQKQKAMQYVNEKCGVDVTSDEADAICIGLAALKEQKQAGSAF